MFALHCYSLVKSITLTMPAPISTLFRDNVPLTIQTLPANYRVLSPFDPAIRCFPRRTSFPLILPRYAIHNQNVGRGFRLPPLIQATFPSRTGEWSQGSDNEIGHPAPQH